MSSNPPAAVARSEAIAPEPSRAGHTHRVSALDGLRGLAALIVVVYHTLLASNTPLANSYVPPNQHPAPGSWLWFAVRTPLHALWAGPEVVMIFFVLSGYVLALPALTLGRRWFDSSYAPRRLVRLFLPAWFALLIGGLLHQTHTTPVFGATWWLNAHATSPLQVSMGLQDATLLDQSRTLWDYTSALWSLSDEILFSILLPVILVVVLDARRSRLVALLGAIACFVGAYAASQPSVITDVHPYFLANDLRYLPVFILGSLLALVFPRLPSPPQWLLPGALVLAACLLVVSYMVDGIASQTAVGWTYLADVLGALMFVWIAVAFRGAGRALSSRPVRWLGSRSFSLYLVHEPIVVAVGFWIRFSTWADLAVAVPLSLLAAEAFWRLIEHPSILLARRFGDAARWLSTRAWRLVGARPPSVIG